MQIKGKIKDILKLERTILNILQRMSGIATTTNNIINKNKKSQALIVPTRKTQWGLLDKRAVSLGGGGTHRLGLYDWILIKDNHIKISNFKFQISNFFEIEVKNEKELKLALTTKPDAIMLDNFSAKKIKQILKKYQKKLQKTIIEASGGINEKNISKYYNSNVDIISLGSLTHSVKSLDISLKII